MNEQENVATENQPAEAMPGEFPGMPDMDTAAKLAKRLIDVNEQIEQAYTSRAELEEQLIEVLRATGRERIKIGDRLVRIKHIAEHDKIEIRKDPAN